ncbi:MAG: hypothetical protein Q9159_004224 [Coniocarpon cinnabarinum]
MDPSSDAAFSLADIGNIRCHELLHIHKHRHDAEILEAYLANAQSLKKISYHCIRFPPQFKCSLSPSLADLQVYPDRSPITIDTIQDASTYNGLANLLRFVEVHEPFKELRLQGVDCGIGAMPRSSREKLTALLAQTERLDLECHPDQFPHDERHEHRARIQCCRSMLAPACNVTDLSISTDTSLLSSSLKGQCDILPTFQGRQPSDLIRVVLRDCLFPRLAHADIQYLISVPFEIQDFLQRNGNQLRSVIMRKFCLVTEFPDDAEAILKAAPRLEWTRLTGQVRELPKIRDAWFSNNPRGIGRPPRVVLGDLALMASRDKNPLDYRIGIEKFIRSNPRLGKWSDVV